jgi:hypothetical protein
VIKREWEVIYNEKRENLGKYICQGKEMVTVISVPK